MTSALVVGDRGCGLTTFVGLLYAAQLRRGTEESDEFRFSADRETIRELEAIYGELVAGRFPERDVDWEAHPLSFLLAFRTGGLGSIRDGGFDTVRLQVGGISADEVAELARHDAVLEESTRRLLRSPVVLPLLDASRLEPPPDGPKSPVLGRYDRMLATTLELLQRFLASERHRRARTMYPLFVVTKFDQCAARTLAHVGAPTGSPESWSSEDRAEVGKQILERYFPVTSLLFARTRNERSATLAPARWFFSGLRLATTAPSPRIARRSRVPVGGWEPEYPFEEYRTLIDHLGRLAHRLPS